jgi:hypothetical protein
VEVIHFLNLAKVRWLLDLFSEVDKYRTKKIFITDFNSRALNSNRRDAGRNDGTDELLTYYIALKVIPLIILDLQSVVVEYGEHIKR